MQFYDFPNDSVEEILAKRQLPNVATVPSSEFAGKLSCYSASDISIY